MFINLAPRFAYNKKKRKNLFFSPTSRRCRPLAFSLLNRRRPPLLPTLRSSPLAAVSSSPRCRLTVHCRFRSRRHCGGSSVVATSSSVVAAGFASFSLLFSSSRLPTPPSLTSNLLGSFQLALYPNA